MSDVAVVVFGRFNPPTVGHDKLLKTAEDVADIFEADLMIFTSKSQDKKKNPLDQKTKNDFLRKLFSNLEDNILDADECKSVIHTAGYVSSLGYKKLVFIAGSDRVDEYEYKLNKYNGDLYSFESIIVDSAGQRDPDSDDDIASISASKMREFVKNGNPSSFYNGLPETAMHTLKQEIYRAVRRGMNLYGTQKNNNE